MKHKPKPKTKMITKAKAKNKTYVGYCHNLSHRGHITRKVMEEKQCCHKTKENENGGIEIYTCPFFKPNKEHAYWKEKEQSKIMRKVKRECINEGKLVRDVEIKEICKSLMWNTEDILDYIKNVL